MKIADFISKMKNPINLIRQGLFSNFIGGGGNWTVFMTRNKPNSNLSSWTSVDTADSRLSQNIVSVDKKYTKCLISQWYE